GLRLAGALGGFWLLRSAFSEGRGWLTEMLARKEETSAVARARALNWAAGRAFFQSEVGLARSLLDESMALCRSEGDLWQLCWGLNLLAPTASVQGDYEASRAAIEESLPLARKLNDPWLIAQVLRSAGLLAYLQGDTASAAAACEESIALH